MTAEQYEKAVCDLFRLWKQQHLQDGNTSKNMPKTQCPEAFIRDGIPYPIEYFTQPREDRVLFVLKESNAKCADKNSSSLSWFRDFVEGCEDENPYLRTKLASAFNSITGSDLSAREAIKRIAIMNINKRGGTSSSIDSVLREYAKDYKERYIKKQIELIDPKYVVCCGVYGVINDTVYNGNPPPTFMLLDVRHPSRGISVEGFAEVCKKQI